MSQEVAWRRFKRMQVSSCAITLLVYAAAALHAWRLLPGSLRSKAIMMLIFPGVYGLLAFVGSLWIGRVRQALQRYLWTSFRAGSGQTVVSVLSGLGLLGAASAFLFAQIAGAIHGGRSPAGAFSAFGAGIGLMFAQARLVLLMVRSSQA